MKIKFIKDFMATQSDDFRDLHAILIKRGDIVDVDGCKYNDSYFDMPKEQAQWLIDNGFAERFEALANDGAFCLSVENCVSVIDNGSADCFVPSTSVRFPKEHQEQRNKFTEFMEAVRTVSQDDGFMRKNGGGFGWPVIEYKANNPGVDDIAGRQHAGEFYFDTREHALNSAMNHTGEWQTILNYDWSRE